MCVPARAELTIIVLAKCLLTLENTSSVKFKPILIHSSASLQKQQNRVPGNVPWRRFVVETVPVPYVRRP